MPNSFQDVKNADGTFFGCIQQNLLENAAALLKREKNEAYLQNRQAFRDLESIGFDRYVGDSLAHIRSNVSIVGNRHKANLGFKLENLFNNSHWVRFSKIENVKNISSRLLSRDETVVLGLGLNFCLGQENNFFIDFNSQVNYINSEKHNDLTAFLRGVVIGSHNSKTVVFPNKLQSALSRLHNYKDIRIMKSDKGNAVVVMNTEEYISKMSLLLADENTYQVINRGVDISNWQLNFNSSLKKIIFSTDKDIYYNTLSPKLPTMPHLYGLPKIHKVGTPMRPIVASLRSPCNNLAKWLTKILSPLVGLVSDAHLKHSSDFLDSLSNVNGNFDCMVSFDVVSLFTNIPLEKVLDFIKLKGEEEVYNFPLPVGKICELIKLCVTDTYFTFNGHIYKQTFGVAMGSSLSPVLANLYMEFFEVSLLPNINVIGIEIVLWKRYVDDIFALLKLTDEHSLEEFLFELNSCEPSIKFTLERSQNNTLPFLDVLLEKTQESFKTKVYRKSTHTNSYIHYFSQHSMEIKKEVVVGLYLRAFRICVPACLEDELRYIRSCFIELAYPIWFLNEALRKAREIYYSCNDKKDWMKEGTKIIKLPYNKKVKEITRNLGDDEHKFVFHFNNTIRKCLCRNKLGNQKDEEKPGVYVIKCNDCNLSYVGESGRQLSKRVGEHKRAVRLNENNSAIARHCWDFDHRMNFEGSKLVYTNSNVKQRRVVEGVLINSIPTLAGNKSFNSLDKLNAGHVIRESNLSSFVKDANNPVVSREPGPHRPNPIPSNEGLTLDQHQVGRTLIINDQGQVVRRSRRNL